MKAVFSFWSKPYHRSLHKGFAGFPSEHYFKVAFELAVLTARDHFSSIELVTDTEGYDLLVKKMGLKFDTIKLCLDECDDIPANLWAFGKLKAYSIQREPFMHLDFDLFLLKPLPKWFFEADILTQSVEDFSESYFQYYQQGFDTLKTHRNIPVEMYSYGDMPLQQQAAHNAGLMGGQNWEALSDYGTKAMQLIRDNIDVIKTLPDFRVSEMNIIYEQAFLTRYARHHNVPVSIFVSGNPHINIVEIAERGLVHLLADSKSHVETCKKMEITLLNRKAAKSNVLLAAV